MVWPNGVSSMVMASCNVLGVWPRTKAWPQYVRVCGLEMLGVWPHCERRRGRCAKEGGCHPRAA